MKKILNEIRVLTMLQLLLPVLFITGCRDYLSVDNYFSDELKLDSVFSQARYVRAYMWSTASLFTDEGSLHQNSYTPGPLATDEAFTVYGTQHGYNGMRFVLGEITASNTYSFGSQWSVWYRVIRKCNTIFARMDEAYDLTTEDRVNILGNTRFIRAYAYYNLLLNFGPPILLGDEIVASNEDLGYYDRGRNTYDETVEYICNELEEASVLLPMSLPLMEFGRPTKGAAYGLIARLRLYHASPLFNGGSAARSYFGRWMRKTDGVHYVSQTYDEKRWALAAAAAKRVMDMGAYRLYTTQADRETPEMPEGVDVSEATGDPDYYKSWDEGGAAGIDHFRSYSEIFTGEAIIPTNPEYVWGRRSGTLTGNTQMSFPNTAGGWNGMAVPQKIIDAYSMADGRSIDNSSEWYPYSETGFTSTEKTFSGYRLLTQVYNMYVNREMRFYASIGFSERFWTMSSCTSAGYYNQRIAYHYDGNNGKVSSTDPLNYPPTGYVITKFIHPTDAWTMDNARRMDKAYAMVRYADILLMYAEALNNLTTQHTVTLGETEYVVGRNTEEIRKAVNQVRHRAGLPGLSQAQLSDPGEVQRQIVKERMIELLFENHRYFDIRRWGIYEEVENEPMMGMNMDANKDGFYRRVIPNTSRVGSRIVNRKLVFVPIPLGEVRRLPSLDQNPGWED
ncbi:MAG: RagB/SusD family nutrient uptake outer membrane protein [Tannerella sp.]|jgi:hypothetical protein|nr:RagB/SusD family nutrient uptake outer membrane protein [Tannerella sp.]